MQSAGKSNFSCQQCRVKKVILALVVLSCTDPSHVVSRSNVTRPSHVPTVLHEDWTVHPRPVSGTDSSTGAVRTMNQIASRGRPAVTKMMMGHHGVTADGDLEMKSHAMQYFQDLISKTFEEICDYISCQGAGAAEGTSILDFLKMHIRRSNKPCIPTSCS